MNIEDPNINKINTEKFNTIMPESDDRALCIRIDKPISRDGYQFNFLDRVKDMVARHGEIRLLLYFEEYKGWEAEAALLDMSVPGEIGGKIRKFALVNPPKKEIFRYKINEPFISGETRYFDKAALSEALLWIKE